ncbi:MAG: hypothetical protein HYX60_06845 [Legionella longbeachae]|nr:hypothetical protein [Legionella longbeachae]
MGRTINKLLFYILSLMSTSVFSLEPTPIEITLLPNKTVVLTNTSTKTMTQLCEMHVASRITHYISIKVISGKGIFNGTTFKKGDSLISASYNMQQIPFSAAPGTQVEVTNLGSYLVKAMCG